MARRYWGARDPVGTFIQLGGRGGRPAQVIAVVGNARFYSLAEPPVPMFAIERISGGGQTALIRTASDPASLVPAIRGTMSGSDNPMMLMGVRTMEEELRDSLLVSRVISTVLLGIGLVAIVLASVGLYGVVAYSMAGRSREFGIRMALGASHEAIVRLVLGYGARLAIVGGAVGLVLGIVVTRLMQSLLFGEASSVIALFASATMLAMITLVASLLPARRATAVSPASALQAD
jgi:ABC-type antimicrobial peptide transport system permease subunit